MPLNVTIAINGKPIQQLTISRLDKFVNKDRWYTYMVTNAKEGGDLEVVTFNHLYRNGAEECVRRALEALSNNRERESRGSRR